MDLAQTEFEFAEQVTDEEKTELTELLPKMLARELPDALIKNIMIKPFTGTFLIDTKKRIKATNTFRLRCTCNHGTEQVMIGQDPEGTWVTQKLQLASRPRLQIGR
jgi:hypothetical protein